MTRRRGLENILYFQPHPQIHTHQDETTMSSGVIELEDGSIEVDLSTHIRLPTDPNQWTEEVIGQACSQLSTCELDAYDKVFQRGFRLQEIARSQLAECCDRTGLPRPRFWFAKGTDTGRKLTAAASTICRRWFRKQIGQVKRGSKDQYWSEAMQNFEGLSRRAFDEIWRDLAPNSWKKSGAPRKRDKGLE